MRPQKRFHVYIMTNRPGSAVLSDGITGNLLRRVWQHKNKISPGFTQRYNLTLLVYYEKFILPDAAIAREKEIKGWGREKKLRLIESMNPRWEDLAKNWQGLYKSCPRIDTQRDPSARLVKARALGMTPFSTSGTELAKCDGRQ